MTEEEKAEILKEQLDRLLENETGSELIKAEIRRLGYSPDRRTWSE